MELISGELLNEGLQFTNETFSIIISELLIVGQ